MPAEAYAVRRRPAVPIRRPSLSKVVERYRSDDGKRGEVRANISQRVTGNQGRVNENMVPIHMSSRIYPANQGNSSSYSLARASAIAA